MELKKNELDEEVLEQVSGGVCAEEHNIMLTVMRPEDVDTDAGPQDFEKSKKDGML